MIAADDIIIDEEFKALIPPLSNEEKALLEENIKRDGCRDPLVVWRGVLIDGHNRHEICTRLDIDFEIHEIVFPTKLDAKIWIVHNQFGRRNISAYTRAELALTLKTLMAEKAKSNQGKRNDLVQNSGRSESQKADKQLAKIAGVSHDTIHRAEVISKKATEETKAALRTGETSINAEYKKLTVHVGQNSGENEWYTPKEFVEAARNVMKSIDCDPASSEIANKTVKADEFFTKEQDGLKKKWRGNVWLNPPYAQPLIGQFAQAVSTKFAEREIKQACILVNNATETEWFTAIASKASAICFPSGRVKFTDPSGKPGAPLQGQAILYLGDSADLFCESFREKGICCHVIR